MSVLKLFRLWLAFSAVGIPVLDVSIVGGQSTINWRESDSISIGTDFVLVEIASSRRVRVTTRTRDSQPLMSPDMAPNALGTWTRSVRAELSKPAHLGYEFENSIGLQPALRGGDSGYVITVADSAGNTRAMFANRAEAEALVVALARAADRVPILSEEDLVRVGRLPPDSGAAECARVRDSVFFNIPSDRWPIARAANRPSSVPKAPVDAAPRVPITASITVLPNGSLDSASFKVTGTTDIQYETRALEFLSKQKWIPAKIGGCAVVSRAGLIVTQVGRTRRP